MIKPDVLYSHSGTGKERAVSDCNGSFQTGKILKNGRVKCPNCRATTKQDTKFLREDQVDGHEAK